MSRTLWDFPNDVIRQYVAEETNYTAILRRCGYIGAINTTLLQKRIKMLGLSTEHFYSVRKNTKHTHKSVFVTNSSATNQTVKRMLGKLGWKDICMKCGEKDIELNHINGVHNDNRMNSIVANEQGVDNLEYICIMCHSYTESWRGANVKQDPRQVCNSNDCVVVIFDVNKSGYCKLCYSSVKKGKALVTVNLGELEKDIISSSCEQVSKKYLVNAKYLKLRMRTFRKNGSPLDKTIDFFTRTTVKLGNKTNKTQPTKRGSIFALTSDATFAKYVSESTNPYQLARKCGYRSSCKTLLRRIDKLGLSTKHYRTTNSSTLYNITDDKFVNIVESSDCFTSVLKKCGTTSRTIIKRRINELQIQTDHFIKYRVPTNKRIPDDEIFIANSKVCRYTAKKRLIELRGEKCENCGTTKSIEMEHINGIQCDHRKINTVLLCVKCHRKLTQGTTWRKRKTGRVKPNLGISQITKRFDKARVKLENAGKKLILHKDELVQSKKQFNEDKRQMDKAVKQFNKSKKQMNKAKKMVKKTKVMINTIKQNMKKTKTTNKKKTRLHPIYKCKKCKVVLSEKRKTGCCSECYQRKRKVERPSLEQLLDDVKQTSYVATGKKYGVSDNCIRKWIRLYLKKV